MKTAGGWASAAEAQLLTSWRCLLQWSSRWYMFQYQIDRLQSVLRAAARLVLGLSKWASVSDAMHDKLHWLPFPERVEFKLCSVVYKCLHDSAPRYLSQYCIPVASLPGRSHLRSAASGDLFVPAISTKTIGPRGFFHAGPTAWNLELSPSQYEGPWHNFFGV